MIRESDKYEKTFRRLITRPKNLVPNRRRNTSTPASRGVVGDRPRRRLPTVSHRARDPPLPRFAGSMALGVARRALGGSSRMAAKALALALCLCALGLADATGCASGTCPSDGAYPDSACFPRTRVSLVRARVAVRRARAVFASTRATLERPPAARDRSTRCYFSTRAPKFQNDASPRRADLAVPFPRARILNWFDPSTRRTTSYRRDYRTQPRITSRPALPAPLPRTASASPSHSPRARRRTTKIAPPPPRRSRRRVRRGPHAGGQRPAAAIEGASWMRGRLARELRLDVRR